MAAKRKIDWERIEPGWRAGVVSVQQLADEYTAQTDISVSKTAINKHFKELGVPRDLNAKVQAKAAAMVSASLVSGIVSTETTATDAQIINDAAVTVASVMLSERKDIARYRMLCQSMLSELEAESENPEIFAQLGELLASPNENGQDKIGEAYRKAISLPQRIDGVKKLADALKTIIGLERQAFGISDNANGEADKPNILQVTKDLTPQDAARAYADMMKGK